MFTVVESAMLDIMKLLEGKTAIVNRTHFAILSGYLRTYKLPQKIKVAPHNGAPSAADGATGPG